MPSPAQPCPSRASRSYWPRILEIELLVAALGRRPGVLLQGSRQSAAMTSGGFVRGPHLGIHLFIHDWSLWLVSFGRAAGLISLIGYFFYFPYSFYLFFFILYFFSFIVFIYYKYTSQHPRSIKSLQ